MVRPASRRPIDWQAVLAGKVYRRVKMPARVRASIPLQFDARHGTWNRLQLLVSENSGISSCSLLGLFRLAALELAGIAAADAATRDPWGEEAPTTQKGAESAKRRAERELNIEAAEDRRWCRIQLFTERAKPFANDSEKRRIFGELQKQWSDLFSVLNAGEHRRRPMTFDEFTRELPEESLPDDRRSSPRKHVMTPRSQFAFLHATLGPTTATQRPANRPGEGDAVEIFSALASALVAQRVPDPYKLLTRFKWTIYPPLPFAGGPPTIRGSSTEALSKQAEQLQSLVAKHREKQKDSRGKGALKRLRSRLSRLPLLAQ